MNIPDSETQPDWYRRQWCRSIAFNDGDVGEQTEGRHGNGRQSSFLHQAARACTCCEVVEVVEVVGWVQGKMGNGGKYSYQ
jgi:hypothetical protein